MVWCTAGDLCLSPRVTNHPDWLTSPRLTTFSTLMSAGAAADGRAHALLHDRYKRLSSSAYDACFSTPSYSTCVVVSHDGQTAQSQQTTVPSMHCDRGPADCHRRLQLIGQNPVMSLRRLGASPARRDVIIQDGVTTDEVDQFGPPADRQFVY